MHRTFDEAAQIAEHLKNDLKLEKVLFLMGGWIHRGYDNQHPDILPAAPECGGNAGLADCARRVGKLGYVFGLHDNYQDMYRDSPSWDDMKWKQAISDYAREMFGIFGSECGREWAIPHVRILAFSSGVVPHGYEGEGVAVVERN